ncbi:uncharacterized protein UV8b_01036 [Ustilaginoidea virens]|uniref:Uncharacterized protein n=1 Tax=Ustilaginoidea virens TaxID=1159556 RepID=A0A8E5HJW3_USTVR|nr:uncharacterized protein UV8b_01036 [Ustilaginoidea virens]QUC16795.1 hypothetical protein UV8b_01036 [Ustilaginoidea virens]
MLPLRWPEKRRVQGSSNSIARKERRNPPPDTAMLQVPLWLLALPRGRTCMPELNRGSCYRHDGHWPHPSARSCAPLTAGEDDSNQNISLDRTDTSLHPTPALISVPSPQGEQWCFAWKNPNFLMRKGAMKTGFMSSVNRSSSKSMNDDEEL